MLFTLFAGIAQFERDIIAERTKEGIVAAKKRGKTIGRPKVDQEKIDYAYTQSIKAPPSRRMLKKQEYLE